MSIHQLSAQNFNVVGHSRKTLNINIPGNVLVFFKMDGCPGCNAFEPIFYQLAGEERRVNYAVINLTSSREVVAMSRTTTTPIQSVPIVLLYVNGNPLAKYNGKKSIPAMKSFVSKALPHAPPQQYQAQAQTQQQTFMPQQEGGGGGQSMYGNGGYNHPKMGPQQGQAGYNQQHGPQQPTPQDGQSKTWMPEIGKAPNMQGVIKGSGGSEYAYLNDVEEDDAEKLMLPNQVTPHNVPWEGSYKKMGTVD